MGKTNQNGYNNNNKNNDNKNKNNNKRKLVTRITTIMKKEAPVTIISHHFARIFIIMASDISYPPLGIQFTSTLEHSFPN